MWISVGVRAPARAIHLRKVVIKLVGRTDDCFPKPRRHHLIAWGQLPEHADGVPLGYTSVWRQGIHGQWTLSAVTCPHPRMTRAQMATGRAEQARHHCALALSTLCIVDARRTGPHRPAGSTGWPKGPRVTCQSGGRTCTPSFHVPVPAVAIRKQKGRGAKRGLKPAD